MQPLCMKYHTDKNYIAEQGATGVEPFEGGNKPWKVEKHWSTRITFDFDNTAHIFKLLNYLGAIHQDSHCFIQCYF